MVLNWNVSERNELLNQIDFKLDYTYVRNVVSSIQDMPRVPSEEERRNFKFDASKFTDAVVMPWYRDKEHPSFYYVAEVRSKNFGFFVQIIDANPGSKFPDEKFSNFNEYFIQKYSIEIYDQTQPLLDVDYTSSRLNLLMPRHTNRSRARVQEERKPGETSSQGQILVPELVDVHPIAASLWNVIAALPTLLYRASSQSCIVVFFRINSLLLADELRETIVNEALNMDGKVPDGHVWPALDYPTPMDDVDIKPVQKIQHLRKEYDERVARAKELEPKTNDTECEENYFEIGVWDPELGRGLEPLEPEHSKQDVANMDDHEDTVGLLSNGSMLRHHGDMSDDEEEDAVVLFDFMNTLGKEKADLFAPRENIIESAGWDDVEVHEEVLPNDVNIPLPIQIYLDSLEQLEDTDRRMLKEGRNEESVDLIQFLDDDDELSETRLPPLPFSLKERYLLDEDLGESTHNRSVLVPVQLPLDKFIDNADQLKSMNGTDKQTNGGMVKRFDSDADILKEALQDDEQRRETLSNGNETSRQVIMAPKLEWMTFSFEKDSLAEHPYGVSPCTLLQYSRLMVNLQALTLSNASDGINLERFETVGDSFLKYAVTDYLFHKNPEQHEGKLSFARSKEVLYVSNCNLYRLGKKRNLPSLIVGAKFDPNDSWLPPCYAPTCDFKAPNSSDAEECDKIMENVLEGNAAVEQTVKVRTGWDEVDSNSEVRKIADGIETINFPRVSAAQLKFHFIFFVSINCLLKDVKSTWDGAEEISPLPYNMLTQQNLSDKSIADAVEALIGAHLLELGPSATLKFMKWMGLKVLTQPIELEAPLLRFIDTPQEPELSSCKLKEFWVQFQFSKLEESIGYRFRERAYLLQAFTHASYYKNRITGCYQRLEFLGDAVLDYVITRFLFQHPRQYSPGVLTDLRSALVNNTIFASLAVKYDFHKHFVAMCPGLHHMIEKFVRLCTEKNFSGANFNAEMYMVTTEEEIDEGEEEDIEVPKAMGDIFESVAGAVYLKYFVAMMKLERILETGKVRVTVDIKDKCRFTGMGRSYRIAKCTAAKRALRYLRKLKEEKEKAAVSRT
ncbi:unnamed protein product [Anisakis simplex]|uniref:Endoribonuclease dcr-1 (inferred by orthology to a C. elegans protein) n=1 Tax=Anisakis simplex TaxID=6269 RepID=A0A0M3K531_ANISI|nr:unnamed protein product [Anisakis simplex]